MLRRILWKTMWVALFCLSAFAFMILGGQYALQTQPYTQRRPVLKVIPESFPVLVVSHEKNSAALQAKIVQYWALKNYLRSVPSYSFLVPESKDDELNEQLDRMTWNDV